MVIPAYNAEALIPDTIRSLLEQTVRPHEIIVVDDGSIDGTQAALAQFGEAVKCIPQRNGGLASARHTGIAAAKGDMIAIMDADDLCDPERLEIQASFMSEHPDVLLCSTDFSAFDDDGLLSESFGATYYSSIASCQNGVADIYPNRGTLHVPAATEQSGDMTKIIPVYQGDVYEKLALGNFIHPPTVMFRREVIDRVGNYDLTSRSMCDWEWLIRVAQAGQIGYIDQPLLRYRLSASQMSSERHWARRCSDTLHVFQRTKARDGDLYLRNKRLFDRKMGNCCVDAADAVSRGNGYAALKWLRLALVQYRYISGQVLRILVKALLPTRAIDYIRKVRASV